MNDKKPNDNALVIDTTEFLREVDQITRERKAREYKSRRDNRQTKRFNRANNGVSHG